MALPLYRSPKVAELLQVQEGGWYIFAVDDYTDCKDLWELIRGQRGAPQDRQERLYILALREGRMLGKQRRSTLVPTESMATQCLTKSMFGSQMMDLLTTGYLRMVYTGPKAARMRAWKRRGLKCTEKDSLQVDG